MLVAFELWTVTAGITFDNVLVTDDEAEAASWAKEHWQPKQAAESTSVSFSALLDQGMVRFATSAGLRAVGRVSFWGG
jgi:hypothetical protein